jgi:hypothetical protein
MCLLRPEPGDLQEIERGRRHGGAQFVEVGELAGLDQRGDLLRQGSPDSLETP